MTSGSTAQQPGTDETRGPQDKAWPEGNPMLWAARASHDLGTIPAMCEIRWNGSHMEVVTSDLRLICRGLEVAAAEAQFGADLRRIQGDEAFQELALAMTDLRFRDNRLIHGAGALCVQPGFDTAVDAPMVALRHRTMGGFLTCKGAQTMAEQWQQLTFLVDAIAAISDPESLARLLPDPDEQLREFRAGEDHRLDLLGAHHLRTPIH